MHPTGREQSPASVLSAAVSRLGAKGAIRFARTEQRSTKLCVLWLWMQSPWIHRETKGAQRVWEGRGMPGEAIYLSESGHLLLPVFTSHLSEEPRVHLEGSHVNQDVLIGGKSPVWRWERTRVAVDSAKDQ